MIDTASKLNEFVPRLRDAQWVALDTEADSLHAYPQKLCLIQFSLPSSDVLIDPLAGLDLAPVWAALENREIIVHGADYDLRMLHKTYGFVPARIFDTMLAARLLGLTRFGLTDLLARFFGLDIDKAPQKANWARRPLTPRMIAYALNDTRHLHPLAALLRRQLEDKGRADWHRQTCEQLVRECTSARAEPLRDAWRVKGASRLGPRGLAVLRALWHWREREAISANRPPFFILPHDTLVEIAALAAAKQTFGARIPARFSDHRRDALLEAVSRAMSIPENELPHQFRPPPRRQTHAERIRLGRLRTLRDRQAAELGLDPAIIASKAILIDLARDWEANVHTLLPWQRELLCRQPHAPPHGQKQEKHP